MARNKFVFVCVRNAGRSQMAAAFARKMKGESIEVVSGGTKPAKVINPDVITVMKEKGINLSGIKPQKITVGMLRSATAIITMGCSSDDFCPAFILKDTPLVEDWQLEDPYGQPIDKVREIRDIIEQKVQSLLAQYIED